MFRLTCWAALAMGAVLMAPQPAPADHISCSFLPIISVVTQDGQQGTTSQHYSPLVTSTQIDVGGSGCVHVQFSAQVKAKAPKNVRMRVTVDGAAAGFPNSVFVTTSANSFDERALTFIITGLTGSHTIGIDFLSSDGTPVIVRNGLLRLSYDGSV